MAEKKTTEHIELRSEEVQDILTRIPPWMIRWGNTLFLGLIFLLLFVSWFVKYPDIIKAKAVLTTKIPPQKVYAHVTAKFDTIFVHENQKVISGQALAVLNNTARYQDVLYLQSVLDTVNFKNEKFIIPVEKMPILLLGSINPQYNTFIDNYVQFALNRKLTPYKSQLRTNKISIAELKHRLSVLLYQQKMKKQALNLQRETINRNKTLFKKGVISEQELEKHQLAFVQAQQNFKSINLTISQTQEALAQAHQNSAGTSIEKTTKQRMLFQNLLLSYNQLQTAIKAWEQKFLLKSAIKGRVAFLNYWNQNQTVQTGDLVFTVIPDRTSEYIAKLKVPAHNSGKIKVGQRVMLSLNNYPESEFGVIKGIVQSKSALPDKEGIYHIDVIFPHLSLKKGLITTYGKTIHFSQEMAGTANIITEDLRLIERLFYQLKDIFNR